MTEQDHAAFARTPLGHVRVEFVDGAVSSLRFADDADPALLPADRELSAMLAHWFAGGEVPALRLNPGGTDFQRAVWRAIGGVPRGRTVSYAQIAWHLARPGAARAVGAALAANPVLPLIPCHRAIGADGGLRGYAGGLRRKAALLAMEAAGGWLSAAA